MNALKQQQMKYKLNSESFKSKANNQSVFIIPLIALVTLYFVLKVI